MTENDDLLAAIERKRREMQIAATETPRAGILVSAVDKITSAPVIPSEGDYFDAEGLLVCGKCNTRKQKRIVIGDTVMTPMCLCRCQSEKLADEERERIKKDRAMALRWIKDTGFSARDTGEWIFANSDGQNAGVEKTARKYCDNFSDMKKDGMGLLFHGPVGTGKTFIAGCIANELEERGWTCFYTSIPRLCSVMMDMRDGRQKYIDDLNRFDLLVLDDLGAERDTEYMGEFVQSVIDARYRAKLPLIATTNLTESELQNPADVRKKRLYSRVMQMCVPVMVKGEDRRKGKMKENRDAFAKLFVEEK